MVVESLRAKYTREELRVIYYDTGICDWSSIDEVYRGASIRDKVVCRFDVAQFLNVYFSEQVIKKYRPVLMMIAKAQVVDPNKLSGVLYDLLKMDEVFANKIHYLFHTCPEDISFGSHIIQKLADVFIDTEKRYKEFFTKRPEFVICVSDGWMYYSFNDTLDGPLLPDKVECEVLSYAKNWNGNFRYHQ